MEIITSNFTFKQKNHYQLVIKQLVEHIIESPLIVSSESPNRKQSMRSMQFNQNNIKKRQFLRIEMHPV